MNIDAYQADLLNRALGRLSAFTEMYGDDESEFILKALSQSFSSEIEPERDLEKTTLVIRYSSKDKSQIYTKFFRTKTFLAVRKDFVDVEVSIIGALSKESRKLLDQLILDAAEVNTYQMLEDDLGDYLMHIALLLSDGILLRIKE